MRFLKIFLISVGTVLGVVGISLGIMYLTGYFNEEEIYPKNIEFEFTEYEVDDSFEMLITSTTEDVNMKNITLSFDGFEPTDDIVSDGNIIAPRHVKIGEPFVVNVVKKVENLNGNNEEINVGGISTLKAKAEGIEARETSTKVFVDVPVRYINIETSVSSEFETLANTFNVDSSFFARAVFVPERSKFKFSRDTEYGGEAEYKDVFFTSQSDAIVEVDAEGLDKYTKKYTALMRAENVGITAQAFSSAIEEEQAYKSVENFTPEIAYSNILDILRGKIEQEQAPSKTVNVNFSQLVVGGFVADTTNNIPSKYNKYTKILVNKANLANNEYSLNAKVLATDNATVLPNEATNFALAVLLETGTGYTPATVYPAANADVALKFSQSTLGQIFDQQVNLYFPNENIIDINHSNWEIAPLKENLNIRLALVLFDDQGNILQSSFVNEQSTNVKYVYQVESSQLVSNQVYWTDPLTENKVLYIYDGDNADDRQIEEYNLKQNHTVYIPTQNTYQQIRYFAYYESNEGDIDNTYALEDYIVTTGYSFEAIISSGVTAKLYELPNGVVTPKYNASGDIQGKVKVLFATVQTDFQDNVIKDNNNYYFVDRFSSNSAIGTPQTMTFVIERTLNKVDAQVIFDENAVYDQINKVFAVKTNTLNAFKLKFDIKNGQEAIFVRDYNSGNISVDFYVNGELNNQMFGFENKQFAVTDEFALTYSVGEFAYNVSDIGFRNIEIRITYRRGNGKDITTNVMNFVQTNNNEDTSNFALQVYDGKIHNIYFTNIENLELMTEQNPIVVTTNLEKASDIDGNPIVDKDEQENSKGVYLANVGSTFSVVLSGENVGETLFNAENNSVLVTATDKYGASLIDSKNYELVSSNPDVIAVDNDNKTISFISASDQPVSLTVQSTVSGGEGNKVVYATKAIWFKVQTQGQIVKINTSTDSIYDNLGQKNQDEDTFTLKDNSNLFTETSIELEITGKLNNQYILKNNQKNFSNIFMNILYAMRVGNTDNYEVFDLRNIVTWTRADDTNLDDFIEFTYFDNEKQDDIQSFRIKENFGKTGYLNFNVQSDIGVNILVKIIINPFVETSISGTFGHENEGASTDVLDGATYVGVYAQKQISISLKLNLLEDVTSDLDFHVVSYLILNGTNQKVNFSASTHSLNNNDDFIIDVIFPEVTGNQKYQLEIVLDSRDSVSENGYEKLAYDYSRTLYFNVNPNIKSQNISNQNIYASSNVILPNILNINDQVLDYAIKVERKVADSQSLSFTNTVKPYVYASITNSSGTAVSSQYFVIENNSLKIRDGQLLFGNHEVYISVFFGSGNQNDMLVNTYKFEISPQINPNSQLSSNKMGFVTYDGVQYLQLLAGEEFEFNEIADCFTSSSAGTITASFDSKYVNQQSYWSITNPTIEVYPSTQLLVDNLRVTLEIQDVGVIDYPVIITPKLWPLVVYDETTNANNALANADLYVNQTIAELVSNEIYDTVTDGQTIKVFADELNNKSNGFNKLDSESFTYFLLDGNGNSTAINFASIDSEGNLTVDNVGQDTFVIVVAVVNNYRIYYRLKIVSSLNLEAFYPYVNNIDNNQSLLENRAEYVLFKTTDVSKVINLTASFDQSIPANATNIALNGEDVNVDGRFMLFKYTLLEGQTQKTRTQKLALSNLNLSIKSIKRGNFGGTLTDVSNQYWGQYAVLNNNGVSTLLEVFNLGNYVLELQATTKENATATYTIVVEQSVKSYLLVEQTADENITEMQPLAQDAFVINSPAKDSQNEFDLSKIYLKLTSGTLVSDRTDELGYTIVGGRDYFTIDTENKKILANYTANDINAQIVFWNKYGEIARRDIVLVSNTKVAGKGTTQAINTLNVYSGQVVNLSNLIDIVESGVKIEEDQIEYLSFEFSKQTNYLINKFTDQNQPIFVILPLNESTNDTLGLNVTVKLNNQTDFNFALNLNISSGFVSHAPNSASPIVSQSVVATENKEIKLFEELFNAENIPTLHFDSQTGKITAELDSTVYELLFEIQNGNNYIDQAISFSNNTLSLKTTPVNFDITVLIKFSLCLEKDEHRFNIVSYYQFAITPDSDLILSYPSPDGQQQNQEKLHVSDEFNLTKNAIFSSNPRVQIINNTSNTLDTKVNLVIKAGNVIVSGGKTDEFNQLEATYTFNFENDNTFAELDFEIYVNGLHRETYTLEVYKDYNNLYSITIDTLNEKEDQNEVFYIAEGRTDIFNGPQALKFNVTSNTSILSTGVEIEYFNNTVSLGTFSLNAFDAGTTKTVMLQQADGLQNLTLENIRFKVNNSAQMFTLQQLTENDTAYFTTDGDGKVNFELFNRIRINYIGIDVTQYSDFIKDKIKLVYNEEGASLVSPVAFNIDYNGLGIQTDQEGNIIDCVTEKQKELLIVYNNQENNLGTYYFKVKSNVKIQNADQTIEITAGQKMSRLFETFGVVDSKGNEIVNYQSSNTPTISQAMQNGILSFDLSLKELSNGVNYEYLDSREPYTISSLVHPLTLASKLVSVEKDGNPTNVIADYEAVAYGAPNQGLYAEMRLLWQYKIADDQDPIVFYQDISFNILPNTRILLYNLDGGENSQVNPQIIGGDSYTDGEFKLELVNTNDYQNSIVYAYKSNLSGSNNFAYDLSYKLQQVTAEVAKLKTDATSKYLIIQQPNFAIVNFNVTIQDEFGYTANYYIQAQPSSLINFISITNVNSFYEGDSFALKTGYDSSSADHEIRLSKDSGYDNVDLSIVLKDSNGNDLNAITPSEIGGASRIFKVKYLDSTLFSTTTFSLGVYFEITLTKGDENYVVTTDTFYLQQRYISTIINNSARDGVEFSLSEKISFTDRKIGKNIGEPTLTDDVTLVIKQGLNINSVTVSTKIKSSSGSIATASEIITSNDEQYYLMSQIFKDTITDVNAYAYFVSAVNFNADEYQATITMIGNSQIKISYYDTNGLTVTNTDDYYDVLLFDGEQYLLVSNVKADNNSVNIQTYQAEYQTVTPIYGYWGIVGYIKHDSNLPVFNILKQDNETFLVAPENTSFSLTLKNNGEFGSVSSKQLNVTADINGNVTINNQVIDPTRVVGGKIKLTDISNESNRNENWLITDVDYSFKQNLSFKNDKRLDIVTINNQESSSIAVNFNGDGNQIVVNLNKDGNQYFSMLEQFKDQANAQQIVDNLTLASTPLSEQDLSKIKDLVFYNDTVSVKVYSANVGEVALTISRTRNGQTTDKNVSIPIKSYAYDYYFGLTNIFGDFPQANDVYTISCRSIPTSYSQDIVITTPYPYIDDNSNELYQITITPIKNKQLVTFTVDDIEKAKFENNKSMLKIGSIGQYENNALETKKVQVTNFYIAKYRNAYYDLSVLYNVTPHYFAINLDNVSSKYNDNTIVISDYTQSVDGNGNVAYKIDYSNWTKNIRFEDVDGNIVFEDGNAVLLQNVGQNNLNARKVKFSIVDAEYGSANFDSSFNIVTNGVTDITSNHITMRLYVALNGENSIIDGQETQQEWLDIGTLTLLFNANYQYAIKPDTSMILSNSNSETGINTFRFARYDQNASGDLSFSASTLFEDKTIDFSQMKTMIIEQGDNKYYLADNDVKNYQISYQLDSLTDVITTISSTVIESDKRFVMIYGLQNGTSVTIKAKKSESDYITSTFTNETGSVYYGKINLSDLTWSNTYTIEYNDFEYPNSETKCFVPLSYIDLSQFIVSFYNGSGERLDSYIGEKLVLNNNFHYSNTFEVVPTENATLTEIKVDIPSNTLKYYSVTEITATKNNYESLSYIKQIENDTNLSTASSFDIKSNQALAVVISDITTSTGFEFNKIPTINATSNNSVYKLDLGYYSSQFNSYNNLSMYLTDSSLQGNNNLMSFNFYQYLYNQQNLIDENTFIKFSRQEQINLLELTENDYYSVIQNFNYDYTYEIVQSKTTWDFGELSDNVVYTVIKGSSAEQNKPLAWNEFINVSLPNNKLFYTNKTNNTSHFCDGNTIYMSIGEVICDVWDGTKEFAGIDLNSRYILKLSSTDKGICFNPNNHVIDGKFNIYSILNSPQTMPLLSQIYSIEVYYPETYWENIKDTNDLELVYNNYYNVLFEDNVKAVIYYTQNYSQFITTILNADNINLNNVSFELVGETYPINLEQGIYMFTNEIMSKTVLVDSTTTSIDINELLSNGYFNSSSVLKYKKLQTKFTVSTIDFTTDTTVDVQVKYNGEVVYTQQNMIATSGNVEVVLNYSDIENLSTYDLADCYEIVLNGHINTQNTKTENVSIWTDLNDFTNINAFA